MPVKFQLDVDAARKSYHKYQKLVHPDVAGQERPSSDSLSGVKEGDHSGVLSEAMAVLSDPHARAAHLCNVLERRQGRAVVSDTEDEKAGTDPDSDFVFEVMELNEQADELIQIKELEQMQQMLEEMTARVSLLEKEIGEFFEHEDTTSVRGRLGKIHYFERLIDRLETAIGSELDA